MGVAQDEDARLALTRAAHVVAGAGLADAFGHVSIRSGDALLITAPAPLGFQQPTDASLVSLGVDELPPGVPKEAWIHLAIARSDPSAGAICRAQPRAVARAVAAGRDIRPLDGHGAMLGPLVPVYADSRLVRDLPSGDAVSAALGDAPAVILRGNGAVTRGINLASAVARMWLLERSAELVLAAPADAQSLREDEQRWWRERDVELLPRMYDFLVRTHGD